MDRKEKTVKGIQVHFLPDQRWYHVVLNPEKQRWEIIEELELPLERELASFFYNIEDAITRARTRNVNSHPSVKFIEG